MKRDSQIHVAMRRVHGEQHKNNVHRIFEQGSQQREKSSILKKDRFHLYFHFTENVSYFEHIYCVICKRSQVWLGVARF